MPLPLLTRAAPSRPSLATRTAAITRPRGGSTASQLLRRSSLRRSQRPPLTAPHLEQPGIVDLARSERYAINVGALGVRDVISVPGRPPPTPVRSMPGPKATQSGKTCKRRSCLNSEPLQSRGHEITRREHSVRRSLASQLTCVAAHCGQPTPALTASQTVRARCVAMLARLHACASLACAFDPGLAAFWCMHLVHVLFECVRA